MPSTAAVVFTSILLTVGLSTHAAAQFTLLADLDTPVPGGTFFPPGQGGETFSGFSAPEISGNTVLFVANSSEMPPTEMSGIYRTLVDGSGPVVELISRRTWLPEYTGPRPTPTAPNFAGEGVFAGTFGSLDFQDGWLAFTASALAAPSVFENRRSVYLVRGNGTNLQVAYRANANNAIGNVGVASDRVILFDSSSPASLRQRFIDPSGQVAGAQTVVVSDFNPFYLLGTDITAYTGGLAFYGFSGGNGLWRRNDADAGFVLLRRAGIVAGQPAAPFTLATMSFLRADDTGSVVFRGGTAGDAQTGIFAIPTPGPPTPLLRRPFDTIATTSMPAPSGTGNYAEFLNIAVDSRAKRVAGLDYLETDIAFRARDGSSQWAIYAYVDDQAGAQPLPQRVIGVGDQIDGKTVSHVELGRRAISGADSPDGAVLVFFARFTDSSEGIYSVRVDEALPRTGVSVVAETLGSSPRQEVDSDVGLATASIPPEPPSEDEASGRGTANPFTGSVSVQSLAVGDARTHAQATQQFRVFGPSPGAVVDVDFDFSLDGTLGVSSLGCCHRAAVHVRAVVYQRSQPPLTLFDGELVLTDGGALSGTGEYANPGSSSDVVSDANPFGDGRPAHGVAVSSIRAYENVVQAQVGETLAVQYTLDVETENEAIADFFNTLVADASTDTPGASLETVQRLSLPEPDARVAPLLFGLLALVGRFGRSRRGLS